MAEQFSSDTLSLVERLRKGELQMPYGMTPYYEKPSRTALEAASRIEQVEAENAALRKPKHVDDLNDLVLMGLARDHAERRAECAEFLLALMAQIAMESRRGN